ncbi:MAG: YafY family transcriptional regulator [Burkholderiales bacterium]|nr:YafY family transcriptional regulator [Burkholderiales bacterium]
MDRTERFYRIDQLLQERRIVPVRTFLESLDVSLATFKRDLEYMRSRLNAPIEWDREHGGYRYVAPAKNAPRFQLPGLWFNASEAFALLTMRELLKGLEPGLLAPHVEPLLDRLRKLIESEDHSLEEIERRIRIIPMAVRRMSSRFFEIAATATLRRRRLAIEYFSRATNETTTREISPQRIVFYRSNWYLDAWCHLRNDIRSFAIDAIRSARLLDAAAKAVPEAELDEVLASGYGIFSGRKTTWAKIRFSPVAARWVAAEGWHPKQKGAFEKDGSYVLEVPYSDPRELAMDILRHGAEAEVLEPKALRDEVAGRLAAALARYRK